MCRSATEIELAVASSNPSRFASSLSCLVFSMNRRSSHSRHFYLYRVDLAGTWPHTAVPSPPPWHAHNRAHRHHPVAPLDLREAVACLAGVPRAQRRPVYRRASLSSHHHHWRAPPVNPRSHHHHPWMQNGKRSTVVPPPSPETSPPASYHQSTPSPTSVSLMGGVG